MFKPLILLLVTFLLAASAHSVQVTLKEGATIYQGDRVVHKAVEGDPFSAERFRAGWVYGAHIKGGQIIRGWVRKEEILETRG